MNIESIINSAVSDYRFIQGFKSSIRSAERKFESLSKRAIKTREQLLRTVASDKQRLADISIRYSNIIASAADLDRDVVLAAIERHRCWDCNEADRVVLNEIESLFA